MKFTAVLQLNGKTATGISVPPEVVESLGAGRRVPVIVTVGTYRYRTTVAPYRGQYLIPVSAEHRAAAGVAAGDKLSVEIVVDSEPRTVELPAELASALKGNKPALDYFESLSHTHKREYVDWITSAKKDETRNARVAKCVDMLTRKVTRS